MNKYTSVKKSTRLLTILCLAYLAQSNSYASQQFSVEAFNSGISTNPQDVYNMYQELVPVRKVGPLIDGTNNLKNISTRVTTVSTAVDNGLKSLPGSSTFATISTAAANGAAGSVNIIITGGLGTADGTYNLPAATITGGINDGDEFTLTNGANAIVLYNRSGSAITTQAQAVKYLMTMYPTGSQMALNLTAKVTEGLKEVVGGAATSVRAQIAAVDAALVTTPTGVLSTDLATLQSTILTVPTVNVETDLRTINGLLNGTSTGSTLQARIGVPASGTTGLAGYIQNGAAPAANANGFVVTTFNSATNHDAKLAAFLAIVSQSGGLAGTNIIIPKGNYTSLKQILSAMNMA